MQVPSGRMLFQSAAAQPSFSFSPIMQARGAALTRSTFLKTVSPVMGKASAGSALAAAAGMFYRSSGQPLFGAAPRAAPMGPAPACGASPVGGACSAFNFGAASQAQQASAGNVLQVQTAPAFGASSAAAPPAVGQSRGAGFFGAVQPQVLAWRDADEEGASGSSGSSPSAAQGFNFDFGHSKAPAAPSAQAGFASSAPAFGNTQSPFAKKGASPAFGLASSVQAFGSSDPQDGAAGSTVKYTVADAPKDAKKWVPAVSDMREIEGYWKQQSDLLPLLFSRKVFRAEAGGDVEQLFDASRKERELNGDQWATVLVLAWLLKYGQAERGLWGNMFDKAQRWLEVGPAMRAFLHQHACVRACEKQSKA